MIKNSITSKKKVCRAGTRSKTFKDIFYDKIKLFYYSNRSAIIDVDMCFDCGN